MSINFQTRLILTCDHPDCILRQIMPPTIIDIEHGTPPLCMEQARRDGWTLFPFSLTAYCPRCTQLQKDRAREEMEKSKS